MTLDEAISTACEAEETFSLDNLEEYAYIQCPACGADNDKAESLLGFMGDQEHHRCRYCHAGWSIPISGLLKRQAE